MKRQYLGCVGKAANAITTVDLACVRGEGTGRALLGAGNGSQPPTSATLGHRRPWAFPPDLVFRTKGQLAIDTLAQAFADGVRLDVACGDEA